MSDDGIDIFDKTKSVVPATVRSTDLPWSIDGYTNGRSFFLDEDTVTQIASLLPDRLQRTDDGWKEIVDGKPRPLAERHIRGQKHFKFRKYWELTLVQAD